MKEEGIPNLGQRGRKEKDRKKFLTRLREYLTRVSKVANQTPSLSFHHPSNNLSLSLSTRCLPLSSKRERERDFTFASERSESETQPRAAPFNWDVRRQNWDAVSPLPSSLSILSFPKNSILPPIYPVHENEEEEEV